MEGKLLAVDMWGIDPERLSSKDSIIKLLEEAAKIAGSTMLGSLGFDLPQTGHSSPPGVACVVVLDESHISFHAYSKAGRAALDVFTCGNADPSTAVSFLIETLQPKEWTSQAVPRFTNY